MDEDIREWIDAAFNDLAAAEGMLKIKNWGYALFCSQQAVEKMIKALIIKVTGGMPLRSHDLMKLSRLAGIKTGKAKELFFKKLTAYYIESRYPNGKGQLTKRLTESSARSYLKRTKAELAWLQKLIQK